MPVPIPLPPNPFPPSALHAAYDRCLALEAAAPILQRLFHCPPPIVCARLLGHLLRLAPAGNGQAQLQREITSATDDANLLELAGHYLSHFLNACVAAVQRPSFEDAHQYYIAKMEGGTLDHRTARAHAKRRDDNCCMLTGARDYSDGGFLFVETAHIIPEATNKNIGQEGKKQFQAGGVWTILSMFTDVNIVEDLAGKRIHRLENIMSMEYNCRTAFGKFFVWLKPEEGSPHTYRVCEARRGHRMGLRIPDIVTFSAAYEYPLPHPAYLALHALCCEVAWMSGAAEYIMDIEKRMDESRVLATDGSTADVLMNALALVETR